MANAFGALEETPEPLPNHFSDEVVIKGGLRIGPLEPPLKDRIALACAQQGENWVRPVRSYPLNYAIYRQNAPEDRYWTWDSDRMLWTCLQISRLVRPTSIGLSFAARLVHDGSGAVESIIPARIDGSASRCWVANERENWIRDANVVEIRRLLQEFDPSRVPERVLRAMWFHEYAHQQVYLDARWALIAIGMEALIHTDERRRSGPRSTRQFVDRSARLADRIGYHGMTRTDLDDIYERRSAIAHGQQLADAAGNDKRLYILLEEFLRKVIRSCILDATVADMFATDDAIRHHLHT